MLLFFHIVSCTHEAVKIIDEEVPTDYSDECEELADLGEYTILETSKSFIPYEENIKRIVFLDSNSNEFVGLVRSYGDRTQGRTVSGVKSYCPLDSTISIRHHYRPVLRSISLEIREINVSILISIHPQLTPLSSEDRHITDKCYIFLNTPIGGSTKSHMSIVVDRRTNPMPNDDFSLYKTQVEIGNKIFKDVYINSIDEADDYEIMYNTHQGLISIRKTSEPQVHLVFDRVES